MIIVDKALAERERQHKPIRIGVVGAGYAARGVIHQLLTPLTGMRLVAICNRTPANALKRLAEKGHNSAKVVETAAALSRAVNAGECVVTSSLEALCQSDAIDVIVDVTGQVEFGALVATTAIEHGKHLVLVNAELDTTLGPILKHKADAAGVIISNTDGDEPGVAMNLLRFVRTIGYRPVMAGNIKGFVDVHRNPDTQRAFATSVGQEPPMITSFADGTKLAMEATILANATGLRVGTRGMFGHRCDHVNDIIKHFSADDLLQQPLVDFALGAQPGNGAFVVGYNDEPVKQQYMKYFKMGDGPLYVFYTPFHLPHLEVAVTIARAALFGDAAVSPLGGPVCDVVAVAKRNLSVGETLDGIGGFTCYGQIVNADATRAERLLPMGLSVNCRMLRDVPQDQPLTYDDVEVPAGRLSDALRAEQNQLFAPAGSPRQPVAVT